MQSSHRAVRRSAADSTRAAATLAVGPGVRHRARQPAERRPARRAHRGPPVPRSVPAAAVLHHPHAAEPGRRLQPASREPGAHPSADDLGLQPRGEAPGDVATTPGPTIVSRYGSPIVVRRFNELVPDDTGFGRTEVSTHLHNFHSGPESDGGPCDPVFTRFFGTGQFYDYFYTMARAGFDTDEFRATNGDVRETLGSLWYHDHRVDHTAENTYKGLVGNPHRLQRVRHRQREHRVSSPELSAVRHPAAAGRQAVHARRRVLFRSLRFRRARRRQAAGERPDTAVLRSAEAALSLPHPGRRPLALLPVVPHQPGQSGPVHSLLADCQRRQPAAAASRNHQHPHRCRGTEWT